MCYSVDLWSAGTIIYQMVTKDPPFNGANHIELLKKIENCKRLRFPPGLSDNCKDLIIRLLKRNPQQRISWELFFQHPWLNPHQQHHQNQANTKSATPTPRTKYENTTPTPYDVTESDSNNNERTPIPQINNNKAHHPPKNSHSNSNSNPNKNHIQSQIH